MKIVRLSGKVVELYDDIESLPITRFNKYNKMLLIDSGIGSDLADFDRHIERVIRYIAAKSPQNAVAELENLRQNIYLIQSGVSPRHMAFAVLVKSINGKPCDDISDDGLKRTIEQLGATPEKELTAQMDAVKKKIDDELRSYFPRMFDDATVKEYFDVLKQRTKLVLQSVINGSTPEQREEIDCITGDLLTFYEPKCFSGKNSVEIQHDKQFAKMCLFINQHMNADAKNMTVLEFYNAYEVLQDEAKKAKRQKSQNKRI